MGQVLADMPAPDLRLARQNWVRWMLWLLEVYEDEFPSKAALGRRLGLKSRNAIQQLLKPDGTFPSFETLVMSRDLTGATIDQMISKPPPAVPDRNHRR